MQKEMKKELRLWRQKMPRKAQDGLSRPQEGLGAESPEGGKSRSAHGERAI